MLPVLRDEDKLRRMKSEESVEILNLYLTILCWWLCPTGPSCPQRLLRVMYKCICVCACMRGGGGLVVIDNMGIYHCNYRLVT